MLHIVGHLIFALGLLRWLTWEYKKPFKPSQHIVWLFFTFLFALLGLLLSELSTGGLGIGNFLLHAVGGGMATACTYEYLRRNLGVKFSWRVELVFFFMFVSAFGVLNELLEYAAELSGLGVFSLDSQDTWRDFVANSSGAYVVLMSIYIQRALFSKAGKK